MNYYYRGEKRDERHGRGGRIDLFFKKNIMKKIILFLLINCISITIISAQPHHHNGKRGEKLTPEMREKMEAYRVAFITEKLELTAEEAQQFWPIFNEREELLRAMKKEQKQQRKNTDFSQLTDAEIQALIDRHFDFKQRELDIDREYTAKFAKVLPLRKVVKLHHLEREFRRKILKEYRRRQ